jgi:DNA helicase MCM9
MDEFPEYCEILLKDSFRYFPIYDEVCVQAAQTLYEQRKSVPMSESDSQSNDDLDNTQDILIHLSHQNQFTIPPNVDQLSHKKNIHFRIRGIPTEDYSIPKLSNKDQLISVKGIVVRCTEKKIIEYQQQFQCKLCEHVFMVKAEYDQHYTIPQPTEPCSNTNEMNLQCNSTHFRLLKINKGETLRDPKDFQEIKIQESYGKHTKRTIPCNMWVTLEDDLVDQCKPGDEVIIA